MLLYDRDSLWSFNHDWPPFGTVRKAIFSHWVWRLRHQSCACIPATSINNVNNATSLPTSSSSIASVRDCRDARIGWLNVHLLAARDHATAVQTTITDESLDVMVLTETWHRSSDNVCLHLTIPAGFTVCQRRQRDWSAAQCSCS